MHMSVCVGLHSDLMYLELYVCICVCCVRPSVPPPLQRILCLRRTSQTNELLSQFDNAWCQVFCSATELPAFQEVEDVFFTLDPGCCLCCSLYTHTYTHRKHAVCHLLFKATLPILKLPYKAFNMKPFFKKKEGKTRRKKHLQTITQR